MRTSFLLLCLNVKEGEYPPPERMSDRKGVSLDFVKTFFRNAFADRISRLVFFYSALQGVGGAINVFLIFMAFSVGLTKDEVGKVAGVVAVVGMALSYPMGSLVDRYHPLRVKMVAQAGFCVVTLMQFVFLFYDFPHGVAFWIYAGLAGISIPVFAANTAAIMPMLMKLFPSERFGQFCSANAMWGIRGNGRGRFCRWLSGCNAKVICRGRGLLLSIYSSLELLLHDVGSGYDNQNVS